MELKPNNRVAERQVPNSATSNRPTTGKLLRLSSAIAAGLFLLALAVQLVRGKLWLVGESGIWALLALTIVLKIAAYWRQDQGFGWIRLLQKRVSVYGIAIAFLTVFGFWLRVWGQRSGLPYISGADESLLVDSATKIIKTGTLEPTNFYYPTFFIYLNAVVAGLQYLWGSFTGLYHSLNDLPDRTYAITTAPEAYIWARTLSAIAGTAAIPLAYFAVKSLWQDKRAALLAAGFICFSALAVEHSHYVAVDMPLATLSLALLLPASNIVKKGRWRDYILCGAVVGLSISTKWNGAVLLVILFVAHLLRLSQTTPENRSVLANIYRRYINRKLMASLFSTAIVLVATTPLIFARIRTIDDNQAANIIKYRFSQVGYSTDYAWLGNLQVISDDSFSLFLLGMGGILLLLFRRKWADWLILSFPFAYLLVSNSYRLIYRRNMLPLLVYFAIFAALFTVWTYDWLVKRVPKLALNKSARLVLPGLLVVAVMWLPLNSIFFGDNFNDQPYSFKRAEDWLKTNAGPGALKLVELRQQQWGAYPNTIAVFDDKGADEYPLAYYRERGIQFVAINRDRANSLGNRGSYLELLQPALIAKEIPTKTVDMPGPPYTIIRTGVTPATLTLQHPLNADFGKLKLLGVNSGKINSANGLYLPPPGQARAQEKWDEYKAGDIIGLSIYWQVIQPLQKDYVFYVHLRPTDKLDTNVASRDTQPLLGEYPTSKWKIGEILTDNPNLLLPGNLAPGEYNLVLGLYLNDGKFTPLPLTDGSNSVTIGKVRIVK
ncbi:phospholipid carrier-dependent glycosyltransferase [Candidatus Chlorohelix sp.]|uniref:phospholipid carrier-dependent glycosyltransferase n=1 Tax=Candidatus Chlorohelix sp. TaxID=3139201 RepID=UPI0030729EA3